MIAKLRGTATVCGDIMRDPTYLTEKPDREACVEAVMKAIATLPRYRADHAENRAPQQNAAVRACIPNA